MSVFTASVDKKEVPIPRLQNVVATFDMGTSGINLHNLVLNCPFVQYTPKRFAAGVLRLKDPRTTCLVFASGKAVCTGATTEQLAQMASLKFVMLLQKHGIEVRFCNFQVQNIVAAAHCNFKVDLCKLADTVNGFCGYEPALFPGLMYRVQVPAAPDKKPNLVVFIVFQSGKCVITGGKNREQILACWSKFFCDTLLHYKTVIDYGNSGNYRMCQIAQRRGRDTEKLRLIANLDTCYNNRKDTADLQMQSQLWPGHEWNLQTYEGRRLMCLLEGKPPQVAGFGGVDQADTKTLLTSLRRAELKVLESVPSKEIQEVLDLAVSNSSESEEMLKNLAVYASPIDHTGWNQAHAESTADTPLDSAAFAHSGSVGDRRSSTRKAMHKRRKCLE